MIARRIARFLLPGAPIFVASLVLVHWTAPASWGFALSQGFPYAIALTGILLGWRFHRSRVVFAVLSLTLGHTALMLFGPVSKAVDTTAQTIVAAVSFLLPLNICVIAWLRERGMLSLHGVCRLGVVAIQIPAVALICHFPELAARRAIVQPFTSSLPSELFGMAQPAWVLTVLALAALIVRAFLVSDPLHGSFFWALCTVVATASVSDSSPAFAVPPAMAALALVVGLIDVSFGMAFRDELTGLPARRAMNEAVSRLHGDYCIVMVDVDHFKRVNDRFGHDVGDQVLRKVASALGSVGRGGKAYRYGGEEFAILFPGKSKDRAVDAANAVRKRIADASFMLRASNRPRSKPDKPKSSRRPGKAIGITVSAGVASADPGEDARAVITRADKALYRAKHNGRNRVCS